MTSPSPRDIILDGQVPPPSPQREKSWVAISRQDQQTNKMSLTPGMHRMEFTDREGRLIPVHYYISGDFEVKPEDDTEGEGGDDSEDEGEIGGDSSDDSAAETAGDEEETDMEFEKECLEHEDLMISQSVLFVCHGVLRNAETYCRNWIPIAERFNLMIVCPEFTQEDFPETKYNYGAVSKGKGMKTWAFTSIEYIFDTFVLAGMKKDGYSLFGHSAGAQFAHRFCLFSARASRCLQIVSANAGWYTLPFTEGHAHNWPYSLQNAPVKFTPAQLELIFSRKLLVLLGQEDVGLKYLRVEPGAQDQGSNRFERGVYFFMQARKLAADLGLKFNWSLRTVANVGHANKHMAFIAASHLFSVSKAHAPPVKLVTITDADEDE
mmetsp:Transcript_34979/g.51224  ORF Transcript_34979/g.51224 Transcript_34979/m.51224 type:complete len:379 (+) Transcript_34979:183-1319(+)